MNLINFKMLVLKNHEFRVTTVLQGGSDLINNRFHGWFN